MNDPWLYLDFLRQKGFSLATDLRAKTSEVGQLRTMNSVYRRDLENARDMLSWYFDRSYHRPLNSLLLGPPGSGKSFIAKEIARLNFESSNIRGKSALHPGQESETASKTGVKFFELNLSQIDRLEDLAEFFEKKVVAESAGKPKIVLLDEFDVRLGSSSVIRYLIQPMYDGTFGKAGARLGKTAFIFSGSYLSSKSLLKKILREQSQIDLPKFIFELYYKVMIKQKEDEEANKEINNLYHMCEAYRKYRDDMTPESDITLYLRNLDKLWDFLSRINGFVIELPDLSAPLDITDPAYALWTNSEACDSGLKCIKDSSIAERLIGWVDEENKKRWEGSDKDREEVPPISKQFAYHNSPCEPILKFKDMLLRERLYVLLSMFDFDRKVRRKKEDPKNGMEWRDDTIVVMKQSLLNYLCTAPLVHGMRSLSTLMWNLVAEDVEPKHDEQGREQYKITLGNPEIVARHVHQEGVYRDPLRLWERIKSRNNISTDGDQDIRISLDVAKVNGSK